MPNPLCIHTLPLVTQLQANSDTYLHLSFFYNAGVVIIITTSKPNFHVDVKPKYAVYINVTVDARHGSYECEFYHSHYAAVSLFQNKSATDIA